MARSYLKKDELKQLDGYFNAVNYVSVAQLYLLDNPLLKNPLTINDIKPKLVGHFGTVPGQNFIYTHLNRVITKYNLNMMYISGPGHGGNAMIANSYLDKSYTEVYSEYSQDEEGLKRLCKKFSFPGGTSSHVAPEVPGSINEGGELGYSLSHAFGAVLDNKDLICACVVGDGEAETGPLATSWHFNKFLNPKTDGVVLPILHLNKYKIANPTVFGRMTIDELAQFFRGLGFLPYYIEGNDQISMHHEMAKVMDQIIEKIKDNLKKARSTKQNINCKWPVLIISTPKGWTGPKIVEQLRIENSFRAHQIPLLVDDSHLANLKVLEKWLKSYHPEELFDEKGMLKEEYTKFLPKGNKRMSLNPHTNGGLLLKELITNDIKNYGVLVNSPGKVKAEDMREFGYYVRDLIKLNKNNFRIFGPDEALSNRLNAVFEVTNRTWNMKKYAKDEYLNPDGRVMDSYLSEHMCEGMLEGYILTGRHGFFHCYEAFIRIVDSMTSQHAKWLKVCKDLSWRKDISSLNYILTSHCFQQDHNGYTHQDPGFINHIVTKKASIVRCYFPIDANTLLCCFDHIIKTKNYINVIIASKHPSLQWLSMDDAIEHTKKGIGILDFASDKNEPNLIMASCGDTPNVEILAAVKILKEFIKDIKIRVINVIDLMKLQTNDEHPHGLSQEEYNDLFTCDKPIIFAYHGYPNLIHQLTYKRMNKNLHVSGYIEEGTITTSFDMRVQNEIDRYHLVLKALKYIDIDDYTLDDITNYCNEKLRQHHAYIKEYGLDLEEIRNWNW